jgi:SAM-dependent methyltransferase
MPTSDHHNIVPILSVIQSLQPRTVLDIGCGFGKYGVLIREYLDVWEERLEPSTWKTRIIGVDAFAPYKNPIIEYVYDEVYIGPAERLVTTLGTFDVVLIADVIEHLERSAAVALVNSCLEISPVLIISTPREFYPQGDVFGNPYEMHRILWRATDFPPSSYVAKIPLLSCDLFVASRVAVPAAKLYLADPHNVLYIRSRNKLHRLGVLGWPLSAGLRTLARWLA